MACTNPHCRGGIGPHETSECPYKDVGEDAIALTNYVKRGDTYVLRSALPLDDPDSWPSQWLAKFGTIEGFRWADIYGPEYASEAQKEFMQKRFGRQLHTACPHCGKTL